MAETRHAMEVWDVLVPERRRSRPTFADQLTRADDYLPRTRFDRRATTLVREDGGPLTPTSARPVLAPGGETGMLTACTPP